MAGIGNILESGDICVGFSASTPFGYAQISVVSQSDVEPAQTTILVNSACAVTGDFFDTFGNPYQPGALQYCVDDLCSGNNLVGWTDVPPAPSVTVILTSPQNSIVSFTKDWEQHQVMFKITDSLGNAYYQRALFNVQRVAGAPLPDLITGQGYIFDGADLCIGVG